MKVLRIFFAGIFCFVSIFSQSVSAQTLASPMISLPQVGSKIELSPAYTPVLIKGLTLDEKDAFKFEFLMDQGDSDLQGEELKAETYKLIKYFMASMTTPEQDLWVNLSPYEKDRIIPNSLGQTEMGRDLLAQDYILKQLTATLMSPEGETGKKFWERIYSEVQKAGISDIPVDTFNKIWIVPQTGYFYEHNNSVLITDAKLKVMLEEDFVAAQKTMGAKNYGLDSYQKSGNTEEVKQIIRSIIIPMIEQEVNEGKNFAPLRQVYNAMLLAVWFKKRIKRHILSEVYVDQSKVSGIDLNSSSVNETIWSQYVETFKAGVSNVIQEEYDPTTQSIIPKKYFVGGAKGMGVNNAQMAARANWRDLGTRPMAVLLNFQAKIKNLGAAVMFGMARNVVLAVLFVFLFTHNSSAQDIKPWVDSLLSQNSQYKISLVGTDSIGRPFSLMEYDDSWWAPSEKADSVPDYVIYLGNRVVRLYKKDNTLDPHKSLRESALDSLEREFKPTFDQMEEEKKALGDIAGARLDTVSLQKDIDQIREEYRKAIDEVEKKYSAPKSAYKIKQQEIRSTYAPVPWTNPDHPFVSSLEEIVGLLYNSNAGVADVYMTPRLANIFFQATKKIDVEGNFSFGGLSGMEDGDLSRINLKVLEELAEEFEFNVSIEGTTKDEIRTSIVENFDQYAALVKEGLPWRSVSKREKILAVQDHFRQELLRIPQMTDEEYHAFYEWIGDNKDNLTVNSMDGGVVHFLLIRGMRETADKAMMVGSVQKKMLLKLFLPAVFILSFLQMSRAQIGDHNERMGREYDILTRQIFSDPATKWTTQAHERIVDGLIKKYSGKITIPYWKDDAVEPENVPAGDFEGRVKYLHGVFRTRLDEAIARLRIQYPKFDSLYPATSELPTINYYFTNQEVKGLDGQLEIIRSPVTTITFRTARPPQESKPGEICNCIVLDGDEVKSYDYDEGEAGNVEYWLVNNLLKDLGVVDHAQMANVQQVKQQRNADTTTGGVNLRSDQADIQIQADESGFKFPKFDPAMPMKSLEHLTPVILNLKFMTIQDAAMKLGLAIPADSDSDQMYSSEKAKEQERLTAL